jgi:Raf kinase inhibitor-like YbhB/YbcL family protein
MIPKMQILTLLALTIIIVIGFIRWGFSSQEGKFVLTCPAFTEGQRLPIEYTCEGKNISPTLAWGDVPTETKSFSLICDDPDAPTPKPWVHWVIFNIPSTKTSLAEAVDTVGTLPDGSRQGKNDFGNLGYGGACPPPGPKPHHYRFKLHALDCMLDLQAGANKSDVETAMQGHILIQATLTATYSRSK